MLLKSPKSGADQTISCKISDFDRLINYVNWFLTNVQWHLDSDWDDTPQFLKMILSIQFHWSKFLIFVEFHFRKSPNNVAKIARLTIEE